MLDCRKKGTKQEERKKGRGRKEKNKRDDSLSPPDFFSRHIVFRLLCIRARETYFISFRFFFFFPLYSLRSSAILALYERTIMNDYLSTTSRQSVLFICHTRVRSLTHTHTHTHTHNYRLLLLARRSESPKVQRERENGCYRCVNLENERNRGGSCQLAYFVSFILIIGRSTPDEFLKIYSNLTSSVSSPLVYSFVPSRRYFIRCFHSDLLSEQNSEIDNLQIPLFFLPAEFNRQGRNTGEISRNPSFPD